jgi:hypothetical protein
VRSGLTAEHIGELVDLITGNKIALSTARKVRITTTNKKIE